MGIEDTRDFWDDRAATFDDEPDHGMLDAKTRMGWSRLFDDLLPSACGAVIDLGCGTGSVAILLAERGHSVLGVDLSPKMIEAAESKARLAGVDVEYAIGDVRTLDVPTAVSGVVLCRHLLWAVEDPAAVVARWSAPLADDGVFIAVEGVWANAGTAPAVVFAALEGAFAHVEYIDLSDRSLLWGKAVDDHRYVMVGSKPRGR